MQGSIVKHGLIIDSYYNLQARCTCNHWQLTSVTDRTSTQDVLYRQAKFAWSLHVQEDRIRDRVRGLQNLKTPTTLEVLNRLQARLTDRMDLTQSSVFGPRILADVLQDLIALLIQEEQQKAP